MLPTVQPRVLGRYAEGADEQFELPPDREGAVEGFEEIPALAAEGEPMLGESGEAGVAAARAAGRPAASAKPAPRSKASASRESGAEAAPDSEPAEPDRWAEPTEPGEEEPVSHAVPAAERWRSPDGSQEELGRE